MFDIADLKVIALLLLDSLAHVSVGRKVKVSLSVGRLSTLKGRRPLHAHGV